MSCEPNNDELWAYPGRRFFTDLGAAQNGNISVAHSATFEQREMARDAKLCVTGQSDGKLIISADGEMPDIDIPVVITLLG